MAIKIVHAADLHIGSKQAHLGAEAASRAAELLRGLAAVTDYCRDTNADILLLAGDIFDIPCPAESDVNYVKDLLAGIPETKVFIAPGNHDYLSPSSPYMGSWSDNVHIFKRNECIETSGARIFSAPFTAPYEDAFVLPTAVRDDKVNILLLHADICGGQYNPITEPKIAATGMDYVALGHVHAPSGIKYADSVPFAYPGSLEPLGFDETGDHGIIAGTISPAGAKLEQINLSRRRYLEITIPANNFGSQTELLEHIKELLSSHSGNMIKLIIDGESTFSPDKNLIKTQFEDSVYKLKVKDRTYPAENLPLLRKEQTLKGIFADKMLTIIENSEGEAKAEAERALKVGLAAFAGREVAIYEDK